MSSFFLFFLEVDCFMLFDEVHMELEQEKRLNQTWFIESSSSVHITRIFMDNDHPTGFYNICELSTSRCVHVPMLITAHILVKDSNAFQRQTQ